MAGIGEILMGKIEEKRERKRGFLEKRCREEVSVNLEETGSLGCRIDE